MTSTSNDQPRSEEPAEQWVLLWSQSANAFHVEPLSDMLDSNRRAYLENRRMDYVPLIVDARDIVDKTADACRSTLHRRADGSHLSLVV